MRDPNRIKPLLKTIERVWKLFPDSRLTQLLSNAALSTDKWENADLFYLEDDKMFACLLKYEEKYVSDKREKGKNIVHRQRVCS